MMNAKDIHAVTIMLGYTIKKQSQQRHFTARAIQNGTVIKTKTVSIGRNRNEDEAYVQVIKDAEELAVMYGGVFVKQTKQKLLSSKARKETPAAEPLGNPLVEKFGNILSFNALLKHAIKRHGIDKVDEILQAAATFVAEARAVINRESTVISAANRRIAQVVLDARKEGANMEAPTPEIEDIIQILMNNEKRKDAPQKIVGNFAIGNEKWDGKGQAPAAIAKYLNENEEHTLEDLRV